MGVCEGRTFRQLLWHILANHIEKDMYKYVCPVWNRWREWLLWRNCPVRNYEGRLVVLEVSSTGIDRARIGRVGSSVANTSGE